MTAEVEAPPAAEFVALPSLQRLLVLDGIQDPGNLVRRQQLCVCCSKAVLCGTLPVTCAAPRAGDAKVCWALRCDGRPTCPARARFFKAWSVVLRFKTLIAEDF